jgi:probable F420-dependent oxidoreductase
VKFVVPAAFCAAEELCDLAKACEGAGFDAIGIADHLVHPQRVATPYPYTENGKPRWEPFTPWPDPWVAIGAMAAVTTRLRFLSTVYVAPLRHPLQVAKTVATAAVMSRGRVSLGVGVGWMREEFDVLGERFDARGRRLDEMLDVIRKLWATDGWVEHHGEFYDFPPLEMSPRPTEPVPVLVGGVSRRALHRAAARGDGWISEVHRTEEVVQHVATLRALRADTARHGDPFDVVAAATDAFTIAGYRRLEDAGVTHAMTVPWMIFGSRGESRGEKVDGIARCGDEIIAKMRA